MHGSGPVFCALHLIISPPITVIFQPSTAVQQLKKAAMRHLLRDWQRWTRIERVAAIVLAAVLLIGVPAALAINLHPTTLGHANSGPGTAS